MKVVPVVLGVVSLLVVAAVVAWEWKHRTSPGGLHASHAALPKLQGPRGCVNCHGANGQAMDSACLACHAPIEAQLAARSGLHGSLPPAEARACAACHTEHTEGRITLVTDRSFADAGITSVSSYDHRHVPAFFLTGKHAQAACERCHPKARAAALAEGERRYLGASQLCTACHEDSHKGTFGADCVGCHGQAHAFKDADGFKHADEFRLENAHANLTCEKCHAAEGPTSVVALRGSRWETRACVACHEDSHKGEFGGDCLSCHGTSLPFDRAPGFSHTAEFPLAGSHGGLACKQCHEQSGSRSVAALKQSAQPTRTCGECHPSPHRAELVQGVATRSRQAEGAACVQCHRAEDAVFTHPVARMTAAQHALTGFPLTPPHDKAACEECHQGIGARAPLAKGPEPARAFRALYPGRPPEACAQCHKDPHAGQFDAGQTKGRCTACHAGTHFLPSDFDLGHHDRCRFPLTGSHEAVACGLCHKKEGEVTRFVPTSTACVNCHKDVHAGRFDGPTSPAKVDGREGCARCHNTASFREITWTSREHDAWTGYPLKGEHAKATCAECHPRRARPDAQGRTLGAAAKACAACHTDVHAGQFVREGVNDCARCHVEEGRFTPSTFDHERDSQFKLDENHARLGCAACHKPVERPGGQPVIRYRPLGVRCQDCHGTHIPAGKERP
ncbi:hypothetical protein PHYC_01672 [Phycisphaerales bacterium]|nr:hypothetical protein PHYC_01672 [Phycisphaerales bacterium]